MQSMWIKKADVNRFIPEIPRPEDEIRIETAVDEEADADLRQIAQQMNFQLAIGLFKVVRTPQPAQVFHKLPLNPSQTGWPDGNILQPEFRIQQQRVEQAVANVQPRQQGAAVGIEPPPFQQLFDLGQDAGGSANPVDRGCAFLQN
jgi:hypothetical protein